MAKEMADSLAFGLMEKGLVTNQIALTVSYDRRNIPQHAQNQRPGRLAGIKPESEVRQLKKEEYSGLYDDIMNLPHPVSKKHPPMPMKNRAAQFSPFAALNGHGAAIREARRETELRRELGEYDREILDRKLAYLQEHLAEQPEVTATYFLPDGKKEGGRYADVSGKTKRIDICQGLLVMEDGTKIRLEDISALSGRLFDRMFF